MVEPYKSQFDTYLQELLVWNEKTNLTAIRNPEEIRLKHFEDSLTLLPYIPENTKSLIDIGAGAGFPGLPIKIARPDIYVTLIDSVGKKIDFIKHIIEILKLQNTQALVARAEELGQNPEYREKFDVAVARAVAGLPTLVEYVLPLVKVGGLFIAQKNAGSDEIKNAEKAIEMLGGRIKSEINIDNPDLPDRLLLIIEKVSPTPQEYPRRTGKPLKNPLLT